MRLQSDCYRCFSVWMLWRLKSDFKWCFASLLTWHTTITWKTGEGNALVIHTKADLRLLGALRKCVSALSGL